ncbi:IclR family transcriptional regulator [Microbacterium sp. Marseille-Q6965]|uniref:IclR family transcriptional regulator n=1 Tax=Microbacterium sp. Marseille-Q6965 TaxID=2965072 RepID=UPI0021B75A22|nr:IclR family transcriptional regulator [Microbacterium sp. Marseille-Q6965]
MSTNAGGTVAKGLEALRLLGEFPEGATAAEVVARLGHPFSTTYRLLHALTESGFVEYSPTDKRYRLGIPVFALATRVAHARGFDGTALPVLRELSRQTGESVLLLARDGDETVTVHKIDGPQFRTTTDPGDRGPLHSSAAGKMLLAALPERERRDTVARLRLSARTAATVTSENELLAQLERFGRQGWAGQSEEHDAGMSAIAAVVPHGTSPTLALAIAAPLFRVDLAGLQRHAPALRDAAARLGALLPRP